MNAMSQVDGQIHPNVLRMIQFRGRPGQKVSYVT
jgi:hypothetical protein